MHPLEHLFYFSCALLYLLLPFHPAFMRDLVPRA